MRTGRLSSTSICFLLSQLLGSSVDAFHPIFSSLHRARPWGVSLDHQSPCSQSFPLKVTTSLVLNEAGRIHRRAALLSRNAGEALVGMESEVQTGIQKQVSSNNSLGQKIGSLGEEFPVPWSDAQDMALRINLSKYTVTIPAKESAEIKNTKDKNGSINDKKESPMQTFALWRTMLREVPELEGYSIDVLRNIHAHHVSQQTTEWQVTPGILPYLDDYEFTSSGGIAGKAFGVPGLSEGTRVETSPVSDLHTTLTNGFVRTSDGSAAYELGHPKGAESDANETKGPLEWARSTFGTAIDKVDKSALGVSAGLVLAGASAWNYLAHHLFVHMYWI